MKVHLCNGVVGRVDSLKTLFTRDTNTNVRRMNHTDVVGAVTNSKSHGTETILDEPDDKSFLQWRHTTADDTAALRREAEQQLLVRVVGERLWIGVSLPHPGGDGKRGETRTWLRAPPSITST